MKRYACRYATVQFMPYPETGEFANVGVILAIPQKNVFAFQLETQKTTRLTHFFRHLERSLYLDAIKGMEQELQFFQHAVRHHEMTALQAFERLNRPLETLLRFGASATMMTTNADSVIDELFQRFVLHDFAKKPSYEKQLQARVKETLSQLELVTPFRKHRVGDQGYEVEFPFAQKKEEDYRVIQPLSFNSDTVRKLIDHGNAWASKLDTLEDFGVLPQDLLIPYEAPKKTGKDFRNAWKRVQDKLGGFGELVPANRKHAIINFAKS